MDFDQNTGIASLQKKIREYVNLLSNIKKRREDIKTLSNALKALSDDIMQTMEDQNIPSCASMGYTFTVKEKTKLKSATAKSFLVNVKNYFKIPELEFQEFLEKVEAQRQEEAEVVTTLECRTQRKKASDKTADNDPSDSFSSTVDDIYS